MQQLKLVQLDDPILNKEVQYTDVEDKVEFATKLYEACKSMNGLGLSANQVGIDNRVFVLCSNDYSEAFFNPIITDASTKLVLMEEGCLSYPGVFISLKRPDWVELEYTTISGDRVKNKFYGMTARVIQHEYDHMSGTNFVKQASPLKVALALKKANKRKHMYRK